MRCLCVGASLGRQQVARTCTHARTKGPRCGSFVWPTRPARTSAEHRRQTGLCLVGQSRGHGLYTDCSQSSSPPAASCCLPACSPHCSGPKALDPPVHFSPKDAFGPLSIGERPIQRGEAVLFPLFGPQLVCSASAEQQNRCALDSRVARAPQTVCGAAHLAAHNERLKTPF